MTLLHGRRIATAGRRLLGGVAALCAAGAGAAGGLARAARAQPPGADAPVRDGPRPDWGNPAAVHRNAEAPRASFTAYPSEPQARAEARAGRPLAPVYQTDRPTDAPWYRSLNGRWKFRWSPRPADRPADFYRDDYDDREADVRYERRVELAFEGLRLFDIRRWKIADQVMPTSAVTGIDYATAAGQQVTVKEPASARSFPARAYLWPIPQAARDLSPNLNQNSGF